MSLIKVSEYFDLEECTIILKKSNGGFKMYSGLKPNQHEIELQIYTA